MGAIEWASWVQDVANRVAIGRHSGVDGMAMIEMYVKCELIVEACSVFESMHGQNVYSYSTRITGLVAQEWQAKR